MALESRMRPRVMWFNIAYTFLCFGLGVWGAYDYWVRIPRQEEACAEYQSAQKQVKLFQDLMSVPGAPPLTAEQEAQYQGARDVMNSYASGAPTPVAVYDRPLQLWVYTVGCGVIGTAWCLVSLTRTGRRRFRLDDDGTLHTRSRQIARDDVVGIDMSRWMAKSIATLKVRTGEPEVLDDFKFAGMHLIVGTYAHRFDPERWNADATAVKRGGDAARQGGPSEPEPRRPQGGQDRASADHGHSSAAGLTGSGDPRHDRFPSA